MATPVVCVTWMDTVGWRRGWADPEIVEKLEPVVCQSIGFLVGESTHAVKISDTVASNGQCQAPQAIARRCILECRELRVPRGQTRPWHNRRKNDRKQKLRMRDAD